MMQISPGGSEPLYRQIYEAVRVEILSGRLRPGQKLPSSRSLAKQFSISRTTSVLAFEMLLAEGYVEGRVGSGTFVTRELPDHLLKARNLPQIRPKRAEPSPRVANRTHRIADNREFWHLGPPVPFRLGLPAIAEFPYKQWGRIAARLANSPQSLQWDYGDPAGEPALRAAVAEHLLHYRGVDCSMEQVIITSGSQQAIDLCARVLLDAGEQCWVEDPGYPGARAAMTSAGLTAVPVPVDESGIIVAAGREQAPQGRMIYVTPAHQYPLGVTMSLARRLELLEWARKCDAWILEDDYDSEYRFAGKPLSPLKSLDSGQRVVYVGTFSKTLFPALRIGYLVVPDSLVDAFLAQRFASSRQVPSFEQSVLARFMVEGHLSRHVRRMRLLYEERLHVLREEFSRTVGDLLEIPSTATGMHVVGFLPQRVGENDVNERAVKVGVAVTPLSRFRLKPAGRPGILMGYTAFDARQIRKAVGKLSRIIETLSGSG